MAKATVQIDTVRSGFHYGDATYGDSEYGGYLIAAGSRVDAAVIDANTDRNTVLLDSVVASGLFYGEMNYGDGEYGGYAYSVNGVKAPLKATVR